MPDPAPLMPLWLAESAALWRQWSEPDPDAFPHRVADYYPRGSDDFDPDFEWRQIGEIVADIIDTLVRIFNEVLHVNEYIDIDVHRVLDSCIRDFGLFPNRDRKIAILEKIEPHIDAAFYRCESPIEAILLFAILSTFAVTSRDHWRSDEDGILLSNIAGVREVILRQQVTIENYRPDFLLEMQNRRSLVIECDGHDFHERTAEQAQRDRARDRWFQMRGFLVLRFTGSEIHRNPAQCASEIFDAVSLRRQRGTA